MGAKRMRTSREQLNKAVSNVPDQQENEPGAHGERERALEEAAQALEAWGDIYGDNAAKCVRALSSPDHADAGKLVEGDGWKSSAEKFGSYLAASGSIQAIDYWNECFGPLLPSAPSQEVA